MEAEPRTLVAESKTAERVLAMSMSRGRNQKGHPLAVSLLARLLARASEQLARLPAEQPSVAERNEDRHGRRPQGPHVTQC